MVYTHGVQTLYVRRQYDTPKKNSEQASRKRNRMKQAQKETNKAGEKCE